MIVGSLESRDRGRPIKTVRDTIKKYLEINELDRNMVYDITLWCTLIHEINPT